MSSPAECAEYAQSALDHFQANGGLNATCSVGERAHRAGKTLASYAEATDQQNEPAEEVTRDLITDLFHLADERSVTPEELLRAAETDTPEDAGSAVDIVRLLQGLRDSTDGWETVTDWARSCHAEEAGTSS
ncbi:hypothetical protein JK364_49585 [Streptomyces sp. 110]|uniref:Uncharacterized protein n=1 Tax=Streptomyces endocoffeicus TaxID=2898945 RepID=A0ABS1Q829_9ACTN|nr:hypothetical protein [Streptomyces endocoffeicus]MBL1120292.1 hypothetical protein [Streptomyces endocoffeicus]